MYNPPKSAALCLNYGRGALTPHNGLAENRPLRAQGVTAHTNYCCGL